MEIFVPSASWAESPFKVTFLPEEIWIAPDSDLEICVVVVFAQEEKVRSKKAEVRSKDAGVKKRLEPLTSDFSLLTSNF